MKIPSICLEQGHDLHHFMAQDRSFRACSRCPYSLVLAFRRTILAEISEWKEVPVQMLPEDDASNSDTDGGE